MRLLLFVALSLSVAVGQSARVEGTVVDYKGETVAKAVVHLAERGSSQNPKSTVSDDKGKFVFDGLAEGPYTLWAQGGSFVAPEDQMTLIVNPGMVLRVTLKMTPQGVISGKVTDQDGNPVAGARVMVIRYSYFLGHRLLATDPISAVTNDQGDYRLIRVSPGRSFVGAQETRRADLSGFAPAATEINLGTFYPSTLDAVSATQMDVTESAEVQGIDIRLRRAKVYTVKGKAVAAVAGAPVAGRGLGLVPQNPTTGTPVGVTGSGALIQPDGSFEFRNVVPGPYVVVPFAGRPAKRETSFQPGPHVTVISSNIEGLPVVLSPTTPITGTVIAEEGELRSLLKSRTARVAIDSFEGLGGTVASSGIRDDGTFQFPTAGAGKYWWTVGFGRLPDAVYVKSASFGEKDVTRAPLDDSSGEGGVLRIVLSSKGASLSGTAPKGTHVQVWPKIPDLGSVSGGMKMSLADQDGVFRFVGLAPGEYYVAAWKELESGLADSPEFLARFNEDASLVKLDEGGHATVDVKMIPPERVAAEVPRLP